MIGAPEVAAFVAYWAFWVLLLLGWLRKAFSLRGALRFVAFWLAGWFALRTVLDGGLFTPYVAVLDIGLVFVVFNGDVRLT